MDALLAINKPKMMTSRDVVNELNHLFQMKKVGHTGTLDPLATGVLIITLGKYTKLGQYITCDKKEYIATVKLGIKTDTLDVTGKILDQKTYPFTKEELIATISSFKGKMIQEVPLYSAVKVNGKRLYEYARHNEEVALPKREIMIYDIELLSFNNDEFMIKVLVSKGTYIRSLINDICQKLNTYGSLKELERTKQGNIELSDCCSLDNIKNGHYQLLDLHKVFSYPFININDQEYNLVKNGNKIKKELSDNNYFFIYQNKIVALYKFIKNEGTIMVLL